MSDKALAVTLGLIGCLVSAFSQVIMKTSASAYASQSRRYPLFLSPLSLIAYFLYFTVTLFSLAAFRRLPLKAVMLFSPTTYLLVGLLSAFVLKEKIGKRKIFAFALMICGIIVFNLPS